MLKAEVGDIVTWTTTDGRAHIGRVAAALELPPEFKPPRTVTVSSPDGDFLVERNILRVVRPNFVQETWNAIGRHGQNPWTRPDLDV
jgi:uncharacterized protein YijF (DUF1287 family)